MQQQSSAQQGLWHTQPQEHSCSWLTWRTVLYPGGPVTPRLHDPDADCSLRVLQPQYFGFGRALASQGQVRQIAGGIMNSGLARGAQVLGFKVIIAGYRTADWCAAS